MPARKGLLAPQNTFLDTIATRFDGTHSNFVLGNAKITRVYPIVYCSDGFCELTGYSRAQIMQKSCACNFLYGPKTDVQQKDAISQALNEKQELKLELILYKSSGTPFWCLLDICGIQNESHEVVLFLCAYKDITKEKFQAQQRQLNAAAASAATADHSSHSDSSHLANSTGHLNPSHAHEDKTPAETQLEPLVEANEQKADDQPDASHQVEFAATDEIALISMDEFGLAEDEDESDEDHDKQTTSQYSRRRSRAVLYQLSGHYGGPRSVSMKSKLKLNNRMTIPEYKTTTIAKKKFILSHYGLMKSCWDWLILIVTFYVAIVVPYNAAFKGKNHENYSDCKMDLGDIIVEVVFVVDVIINFRTTFVNRKGEVVTKPKIICKHYIKGWFVVDACAAFPFDLLCSLNISSPTRGVDLNLLKLIRLLRLARLLQKMDRYSQYSYIILTLLMLIFSLLAHWCACIWYVIATEEIKHNKADWKIGWIHHLSDKLGYNVFESNDLASSYVTALYFTTSSLTSVGFGNVSANTNAEKIFSIVIMLIGALMHAVVFGNVTALIRVMYARRSNYQTRLRDLKDFFRLHQLPKELQQRMSDYFQTTWSLNHGIEISEILRDFPEELRGDVSLHLHREVLTLPIFATAPQGFLKSLARHIESKFCCPTEYLIHRGDALNYLYLVCNGSMEVLQDNMVVGILGKGDLVGYDVAALATPEHTQFSLNKVGLPMSLVKSSSDLKALTYCDLKCIYISGLLDVLKLYPEFSDTFHNEIMHDLSFNLRETHEDHGDEEDDEEDDDEDEDEGHRGDSHDDHNDTDSDGNQPMSAIRSRRTLSDIPSSPPEGSNENTIERNNLNRLYRSITANGNQIGRYDHDDEDDIEIGIDSAGKDHDEDDDAEDEQDDVADEDAEHSDENKQRSNGRRDDRDDGNAGAGAGGATNGRTEHSNDSQEQRDSHRERNNDNDKDQDNSIDAFNSLPKRHKAFQRLVEFSCGSQEELDVDSGQVSGSGEPSQGKRSPLVDPRLDELRRDTWQSSHSDEGLTSYASIVGGLATGTTCSTSIASSVSNRHLIKNYSDEALLKSDTHAQVKATSSGEANSLISNISGSANQLNGSTRLPLKPAIANTQSRFAANGLRRPPLAFDLSRNTTAIVDRRRRSAGCISRTLVGSNLLIGASSLGSNLTGGGRRQVRPAGHSSLTHINEDVDAIEQERQVAKRTTHVKWQANDEQLAAGKRLKDDAIDSRIESISKSMKEMRRDMNEFKESIQILMQMVATNSRKATLKSFSLNRSYETNECPPCYSPTGKSNKQHKDGHKLKSPKAKLAGKQTERETSAANPLIAATSDDQLLAETFKIALLRSQSTTSLRSSAISNKQRQCHQYYGFSDSNSLASRRARNCRLTRASVSLEHPNIEQKSGSCSGASLLQEVTKDPCDLIGPREVINRTTPMSSSSIKSLSGGRLIATPLASEASESLAEVRVHPSSSTRRPMSLLVVGTNSQTTSQANQLQLSSLRPTSQSSASNSSVNLHSDYDSGRSSSSTNSSLQQPVTQIGQLASEGGATGWSKQQADSSLEARRDSTSATSGARFARMLLTSSGDGANLTAHCFTIDMADGRQFEPTNEPQTQTGDSSFTL